MDRCFAEAAMRYEREAVLQGAVARRLARLCEAAITVPPGPQLDLGAGSGQLARALQERCSDLNLLLIDRNPHWVGAQTPAGVGTGGPPSGKAPFRLWDLEAGLPSDLCPAALLASSFTLHWLQQPERTLRLWCESLLDGGWLMLAAPILGSLRQWHEAATAAGVPCTALCFPDHRGLLNACDGLTVRRSQLIQYTQWAEHPFELLKQFRRQGTQASRHDALTAGQWRRLGRAWPMLARRKRRADRGPGTHEQVGLSWKILLLVAQAEGQATAMGEGCA